MGKNMYKTFRSAREIWHQAEEALLWSPNPHQTHPNLHTKGDSADNPEMRAKFEAELAKTAHMDPKQGFGASGTGITRSRRGWLRDLVVSRPLHFRFLLQCAKISPFTPAVLRRPA